MYPHQEERSSRGDSGSGSDGTPRDDRFYSPRDDRFSSPRQTTPRQQGGVPSPRTSGSFSDAVGVGRAGPRQPQLLQGGGVSIGGYNGVGGYNDGGGGNAHNPYQQIYTSTFRENPNDSSYVRRPGTAGSTFPSSNPSPGSNAYQNGNNQGFRGGQHSERHGPSNSYDYSGAGAGGGDRYMHPPQGVGRQYFEGGGNSSGTGSSGEEWITPRTAFHDQQGSGGSFTNRTGSGSDGEFVTPREFSPRDAPQTGDPYHQQQHQQQQYYHQNQSYHHLQQQQQQQNSGYLPSREREAAYAQQHGSFSTSAVEGYGYGDQYGDHSYVDHHHHHRGGDNIRDHQGGSRAGVQSHSISGSHSSVGNNSINNGYGDDSYDSYRAADSKYYEPDDRRSSHSSAGGRVDSKSYYDNDSKSFYHNQPDDHQWSMPSSRASREGNGSGSSASSSNNGNGNGLNSRFNDREASSSSASVDTRGGYNSKYNPSMSPAGPSTSAGNISSSSRGGTPHTTSPQYTGPSSSSLSVNLSDVDPDLIEDAFRCVRHQRNDDLERLMDQIPVDVRDIDGHGNTLLITAAQNGNKKAAKILLRRGAQINLKNNKGNTALHFALHFGYKNSIGEVLLANGADSTIRNNNGKLCFDGI